MIGSTSWPTPGSTAPPDCGGLGLEAAEMWQLVETLAGGCLTTAFVWLQHHASVRTLSRSDSPLRASWLPELCRGRRRAGIALAAVRPGADPLRAVPLSDGAWSLRGSVPWVTGWRLVDCLLTAALLPGDDVGLFLIDVPAGLSAERQRLSAVNASDTVTVGFHDHRVEAHHLLSRVTYDEWRAGDAAGLRPNGSLALGVASRCCRLLGPTSLDEELNRCRDGLDRADADALPRARAAASMLAARASDALVVATGSPAVLTSSHAQRLAREARFLLVFGSRPPIRQALLEDFGVS